MFRAKTIDNLLSESECSDIVWVAENSGLWEKTPGNEYWDERAISINTVYSKFHRDLGDFIRDKTFEIKSYIEKEYGLDKEVYADTASICRWFPGSSQTPHADDMIVHGVTGFEHRVFASIIYLNVGYTGGKTYYPNQNFEITPEVGKVAIHPGDEEHLHGVSLIGGGMRYTIASFWTYDKGRSIDWSIFER